MKNLVPESKVKVKHLRMEEFADDKHRKNKDLVLLAIEQKAKKFAAEGSPEKPQPDGKDKKAAAESNQKSAVAESKEKTGVTEAKVGIKNPPQKEVEVKAVDTKIRAKN